MDFTLNDDQQALQDELRRFLGDRFDSEAVRSCIDRPGAVDPKRWKELADMGVFNLCLTEEAGGLGMGLAEAVIVFEELGRRAVPGPLITTFLAAGHVEGAATGDALVGMVGSDAPAIVEHLDALDVLLILTEQGLVSASVPEGMTPVARPLDPLTPIHIVEEARPGAVVIPVEQLGGVQAVGALLAAAMQVGLGQSALDLGVGYANEREQFNRVIGSFQAVKHLLADAAVAVDIARAGVHHAAVSLDEGAARPDAVERARIVASRAVDRACRASIQVHGGIGYTWELDAHLFLKRAMVLDQAFGSVDDGVEFVAAGL